VILTSHVMSELEELADDVAFLLEGRVAFVGAVADLLDATRQVRLERAVAQVMAHGWPHAGRAPGAPIPTTVRGAAA
jgi:Cu-processing system ATP-binding protein